MSFLIPHAFMIHHHCYFLGNTLNSPTLMSHFHSPISQTQTECWLRNYNGQIIFTINSWSLTHKGILRVARPPCQVFLYIWIFHSPYQLSNNCATFLRPPHCSLFPSLNTSSSLHNSQRKQTPRIGFFLNSLPPISKSAFICTHVLLCLYF